MDRKLDNNVRQLCGKSFANDEAWFDHVKSCLGSSYKHTVTTMSSSSSTQRQETVFPLPGWGCKKTRTGGHETPPSDSSSLSEVDVNQVIELVRDTFEYAVDKYIQEQSELGDKLDKEEGLEEQSELNKKLVKVKQEEGIDQALDHETGLKLGSNVKIKPDAMKELLIGNQEKYMCKECGLEFDLFRGLQEHESIHYMKKWMEEEECEDGESKAKKNSKKEFKCEICDKNFASKQSLGRHNKVHIKNLDLNQLPPDY